MTADMEKRPAGDVEQAEVVDTPPERQTVYGTITGWSTAEQRPIVPAWMRNPEERRQVARLLAKRWAHEVGYHVAHSPMYAARALVYAPRGAARLARRGRDAWFDGEGRPLRATAVAKQDADTYLKLDAARRRRVRSRTPAAVGVLAGALALLVVILVAPTPARVVALAGLVAILGHVGAPADRPLVLRALVTAGQAPKPTSESVTAALRALGISALAAKDAKIDYPHPIRTDGPGWRADVDLPLGVTATMVMDKRSELASGLRRPLGCVWPEPDTDAHTGRLVLWVGMQDMAKARPAPYPLRRSGTADFFDVIPFGTDQRGRPVTIPLAETNTLVGALPGGGKALALDTPVPTPEGWSTMGALADGDMVFDEIGSPCRVVAAWPVRHGRPCFEVAFSDGSTIVADADHLWSVETRASRMSALALSKPKNRTSSLSRDMTARRATPKVLTTAEMAETLTIEHGHRLNYSVLVAAPLQTPPTALPVDPYLLGCWLGDGDAANGRITKTADLFAILATDGHPLGVEQVDKRSEVTITRTVLGLVPRLRAAGVLGHKHIPTAYFRASEGQRRALLAGLMDTDGTVDKRGRIVFAVSDQRLAKDVRSLTATLGFKSSLTSKRARFEDRDYGLQWSVTFTTADPVFRLPRKAARQVSTVRSTAGRRYVTSIRPVASVPVRCITVDSRSSLYLIGDQCIPTHNTAAIRCILVGCSLDPTIELHVFEHKGSGDLEGFQRIAHSYGSGVDDETIGRAAATVTWLLGEVGARSERIKALRARSRELAPDSKVTRELANRRGLGLHPIVVVIDEAHELFGHPEYGKLAGEEAERVIRRGRAFGVHLILATQRPDKDSLPTGVSANVGTRFCLRVMGQVENDMILGTSSYRNGIRATTLRPSDRGIGYLVGAGDTPVVVRTYYLDAAATDAIVARAYLAREKAGLLTGQAAGEVVDHGQVVDVGMDVRTVFATAEVLHTEDVLARLADLRPQLYGGWRPEQLAAALRPLGIGPGQVSIAGVNRQGYRLEPLAEALAQRELSR